MLVETLQIFFPFPTATMLQSTQLLGEALYFLNLEWHEKQIQDSLPNICFDMEHLSLKCKLCPL